MKISRWKSALRAIAIGGLALAWLGVICRGRDSWVVPAVVYYSTPWLLRFIAGLAAVIVVKHWGLRLMAATCILVSAMEAWHSFRLDSPPAAAAGSLQVAIYNTGRALEKSPKLWPVLASTDITAVVEAGRFTPEAWQSFIAGTPEMEWARFEGTMLGVRGKILSKETLGVVDRYKCYRIRVSLPDHGEIPVIVIDIESNPTLCREQAMAGIRRAAGDDPKAIILGDFNTPPESKWYRDWRPSLSLANDGPRRGFRETWAYGLPLLTLDQIWIGNRWKAEWTEHTRHGSDHSRVKTVLQATSPGAS